MAEISGIEVRIGLDGKFTQHCKACGEIDEFQALDNGPTLKDLVMLFHSKDITRRVETFRLLHDECRGQLLG